MGIFISCRDIASGNHLIGGLRRKTWNVYNSDKSSLGSFSDRRNLLIKNDMFLNP